MKQLSKKQILLTWLAATVPMGLLAWVFAPWLADRLVQPHAFTKALLISLALGLVWQGVLVYILVKREVGELSWKKVKRALWLEKPVNPKTKKIGGNVWWMLVPYGFLFVAIALIPSIFDVPADRDFASFLDSEAGEAFFSGAWLWYGLTLIMFLFNTVLGEELLFRGYLLPRMNKAYGEKDYIANGVLFSVYHVHQPWTIPATMVDIFALSYPSKKYKSAWFGIITHSLQSILIGLMILFLVIG